MLCAILDVCRHLYTYVHICLVKKIIEIEKKNIKSYNHYVQYTNMSLKS